MQLLASVIPTLIIWEDCKARNEVKHSDSISKAMLIILEARRWIKDINQLIVPKKVLRDIEKILLETIKFEVKISFTKKPILLKWKTPKEEVPKQNIDRASTRNPGRT